MVCAYNLGIWGPEAGELEVLSDLGLYSDTLHQNTYIRKIPSSYISYVILSKWILPWVILKWLDYFDVYYIAIVT